MKKYIFEIKETFLTDKSSVYQVDIIEQWEDSGLHFSHFVDSIECVDLEDANRRVNNLDMGFNQ